MAVPSFKPEIRRHMGGFSTTSWVLDMANSFSRKEVAFEARAWAGTWLNLDYVFIPEKEHGWGPEQRASREIGEFSPSRLAFRDSSRWEKFFWKPGPFLVSGRVKAVAKFRGSAEAYDQKMEILVKGAGPRMLYWNREEKEATITLAYKGGSTKDYEHRTSGFFSFRGPVGCRVKLKLTWNGLACGHEHDRGGDDPAATGYFSGLKDAGSYIDLLGKDRPVQVDYINLGVCGEVTVVASFFDRNWTLLRTQTMKLRVIYKLLSLLQDSIYYDKIDNMEAGRDSCHPQHLYGTMKLIQAIENLSRAFYQEFNEPFLKPADPIKPGDGWSVLKRKTDRKAIIEQSKSYKPVKLKINDMSLPYGGRFDIGAKNGNVFVYPHETHMFGEHVDISYNGLNKNQINTLKERAKEYFAYIKPEDKLNHIHLRI